MNTPSARTTAWLTGAGIGLVLLVCAPMIWHSSNYLLPSFWTAVFIVTVIAGGAVVVVTEQSIVPCAVLIACGVLCAYALRIVMDTYHDRTNHNLWPFEIVLDFVGLFAAAALGGALGALATRETKPRAR